MSMLSHKFSVVIESGISALWHERWLVYILNTIDKRFISQLISTVQLPGAKGYNTQIVIHTGTRTTDVILAIEIKKHMSNVTHKHGVIDKGK